MDNNNSTELLKSILEVQQEMLANQKRAVELAAKHSRLVKLYMVFALGALGFAALLAICLQFMPTFTIR